MCAVKLTQAMRVRRSLEYELPSFTFDDIVIEYFTTSLDGAEPLSENMLVEHWSPFLIARGACKNEDDVRGVCHGLLLRLQSEQGFGPTFDDWLETLCISQYAEQARAWCEKKGVAQLDEVLEQWEDLADTLSLKLLERKRVQKFVASRVPSVRSKATSQAPAPAAPVVHLAVPRTRPQPGMMIGPKEDPKRYLLLEEIGSGATAIVHKCLRGSKTLAVKTISLSKLKRQRNYQQIKEKLQREISILFSLQHQRIVSLHDIVEDPDQALHLVMELVPGTDMYQKIVEHSRFAEVADGSKPLARHVFIQIADGLRYIHSKDIVHRDLKPENILVDEPSSRGNLLEVKVSDFGHSKLINDGYSLALTAGVGTPQYWAPEVSDPRKAALGYDQHVDLWSLGVVLYVMLAGSYPFRQGDRIEEKAKTAQFSFETVDNADISSHAKDLVCSLIKVNPEDRKTVEGCLAHSWVAVDGVPFIDRPDLDVSLPRQEVRMQLPLKPTKAKVQTLRRDLLAWQKKFCCAATVKHKELIVNYGEMQGERQTSAYLELASILEQHFPSFQLPVGEG